MLTSTEDIFRELIVEDIFWSNTIQPTTPPEAFQVTTVSCCQFLRPQKYINTTNSSIYLALSAILHGFSC